MPHYHQKPHQMLPKENRPTLKMRAIYSVEPSNTSTGERWNVVGHSAIRKALTRAYQHKTSGYHGTVALGRLPETIAGDV